MEEEVDPNVYQQDEDEYKAWFKDETTPPPFQLFRRISSKEDAPVTFQSVAIFPWGESSLGEPSNNTSSDVKEDWLKLVSDFWDAVAVGSEYGLYVFFTFKKSAPLWVQLPEARLTLDEQKLLKTDKMCVAWAMPSHHPWRPCIIFSRGSLLYVYDVVGKGLAGAIRGHGGAITSISVHPKDPNLFCTTSRDFTTRIYDLDLSISEPSHPPGKKPNLKEVPNPHWPPGKKPSLAGAPHGLHLHPSESEGRGRGRCVIVLLGGRSGGHQAAVLGSAFHFTYPVIATCGLDRTVKIWPVWLKSSVPKDQIKREDKPLFSSSMLHRARILSVSWLQDDLLMTHSAPAIMRKSPDSKTDKRTYTGPGELVIWRWLGVDRFFPPVFERHSDIQSLRGCSSDYQESSSFKLISIHSFPDVPSQYIVPQLSIFQAPWHDTLVLYAYPDGNAVFLLNAAHMKPRERPALPEEAKKLLDGPPDTTGAALADATGRMHLTGEEGVGDEEQEEDERIILRRPEVAVPKIDARQIGLDDADIDAGRTLMACAMGMGGRVVVGVGSKATLWVWRYDD